ncbi:MAG: RNA-directed DNA polymerase [Saprospirales bacterium]|nr:RNA-directed DNA polymerase [Saprospirales bacterium]
MSCSRRLSSPATQFHLPKPNGDRRLIESAEKPLRLIQKHLQQRLQAVYYTIRPDCAYGGMLTPFDEPHVRNIYTNAQQHIGKKWVLHFDLKDFFPNINSRRVFEVFSQAPFQFPEPVAQILTQLSTHHDRLPQGASSSPILANLVCLAADRQLNALAQSKGWTYTRYIDDMTFSGKKRFRDKHVEAVCKLLEAERFIVNLDKVAICRMKDEPEVTGLVLKGEKPDVSPQFLRDLQGEVTFYRALTDMGNAALQTFSAQTLQRFRLQVLGKINFLRFVRGDRHKSVVKFQLELG